MLTILSRRWSNIFKEILKRTNYELVISSPYLSNAGIKFIIDNLNPVFREIGQVSLITDLSPMNIYHGATDPKSIKLLMESIEKVHLWHLPSLHAKVYISDDTDAIVTSGNLTSGGLFRNFEYGVNLTEERTVRLIKNDIRLFSELGAKISYEDIIEYCHVSDEIKKTYTQKEENVEQTISAKFKKIIEQANDKLIKLRLAEGPPHTVFEKTILYLLKKHGSLSTDQIHNMVKDIHPDLCDNTIDRVIDGKRFGKKWKHAVRTSQQHLKKKGLIYWENDKWYLVNG